MKIIIDCREHELYDKIKNMEKDETIEITKEALPLGDILFTRENKDVLLIERKSVADLIASIKDGRYKEQSFRLSNSSSISLHNIVYIIEGSTAGLPPVTKKMVYGAITSIAFLKKFSVLRTWTVGETAELLLNMARKIEKDWVEFSASAGGGAGAPTENETTITLSKFCGVEGVVKSDIPITHGVQSEAENVAKYTNAVKKVKKDNITADNIGEIMLSQIPGVGSQPAIEIMKKYRNIAGLVNALREDPNCLENMQVEGVGGKKRRMNSTAIKKIREYLSEGTTTAVQC